VSAIAQRIALEKVKGLAIWCYSVHKFLALGLLLSVRVALVYFSTPLHRKTINLIKRNSAVTPLSHLFDLTTVNQIIKIGRRNNSPGELRVAYAYFTVNYLHIAALRR
jgi:hypothetical protein